MSQAGGEEAGVPAILSRATVSHSPRSFSHLPPENGTYWDGVGDDDHCGDDHDDDGDEG